MPAPAARRVFIARTKIYRMGEATVEALGGIGFELDAGEVIDQDKNLTSADEAALTAYRRTEAGFGFQFYNLMPP